MPAEADRSSASDAVIRAGGVLLLAVYPVVVWLGLARVSVRAMSMGLALIVAVALLLRVKGQKREHALVTARIPMSIGVLLLLGALFDDRRFVLALPVLTNVALLAQFAASLRGMPMAERFARAHEDVLRPAQVAYCRSVTIVWCVFFVVNGTVTAALALFAPLRVWATYAGGLSYVLVGLVAATEYAVRRIRFRQPGTPLDRLVSRALGRLRGAGPRARPSRLVRDFELRPRADCPGAFDVHVPVDLAYFEGHFDGHAILPGVVQVEVLVARQVATTWPELAHIRRVTRLRFKRPIRPGDDLVLEITRPERKRVDFDVRRGTEPCSSGTLHFEV